MQQKNKRPAKNYRNDDVGSMFVVKDLTGAQLYGKYAKKQKKSPKKK